MSDTNSEETLENKKLRLEVERDDLDLSQIKERAPLEIAQTKLNLEVDKQQATRRSIEALTALRKTNKEEKEESAKALFIAIDVKLLELVTAIKVITD